MMESEVAEQQTKERLRTRWTASLDKIFADLVVEQIQLGNRPNNIFDKKTWSHIRDQFNKQTSLNFNNNQLRKHLDVLRTRYNQFKSSLILNDFPMDDSCCIGFDLWDGIGVNSRQEPVKIKDCPIYEQLCIIFADNGADGRFARSSHYEEIENKSKGNNTTALASCHETEAQSSNPENIPSSLKSMEANAEKGSKNNSENKRKRSLEAHQNGQRRRDQEKLNTMAQAMFDMIAASKVRTVAIDLNKEKYSITNCINALDEIEGMRNSLYLTALDLFDEPNLRETFISLNSNDRRLLWLEGKCSSASLL